MSFVSWQKLARNYVTSLHNKMGITLAYVIREYDMYDEDPFEPESTADKYAAWTRHAGKGYVADNKRVWEILQPLIITGPGWAYIRQFEKDFDGQKAWVALNEHYLGSGPTGTEKSQAYSNIEEAMYRGETMS